MGRKCRSWSLKTILSLQTLSSSWSLVIAMFHSNWIICAYYLCVLLAVMVICKIWQNISLFFRFALLLVTARLLIIQCWLICQWHLLLSACVLCVCCVLSLIHVINFGECTAHAIAQWPQNYHSIYWKFILMFTVFTSVCKRSQTIWVCVHCEIRRYHFFFFRILSHS